jgi:hypothetical protein
MFCENVKSITEDSKFCLSCAKVQLQTEARRYKLPLQLMQSSYEARPLML